MPSSKPVCVLLAVDVQVPAPLVTAGAPQALASPAAGEKTLL